MNKLKNNKKIVISIIVLLLAMGIVGIGMADTANSVPIAINPKLPAPTAPAGFTDQQVQQAKVITEKELGDTYKNLSASKSSITSAYQAAGSNKLYGVISNIEDQYIVNYQGAYLQIPIKTEIWNSNFQNVGGAGYANYDLYYWNYYSNGWIRWNGFGGYTNSNGQVNFGFSVPNKLSDRFFITGANWYWVDNQWANQAYTKYFRVSWY